MIVARAHMEACCLSRPTDDQTQLRILNESRAIEQIFALIQRGAVDLISSEALRDEVRRNPVHTRRIECESLLCLARENVEINGGIIDRARQLTAAGYEPTTRFTSPPQSRRAYKYCSQRTIVSSAVRHGAMVTLELRYSTLYSG